MLNLEAAHLYWVNVRADGSDWVPDESVVIPRHHALALAFDNRADFPTSPELPGQALRVTFRFLAQEIRPVPGRNGWRNTIRGQLIEVCPLSRPGLPAD